MNVVAVLQIVTQGGAVVLLALVLLGLWRIAKDTVPAVKDFLLNLTASVADLKAKVAVIDTKVDAVDKKAEAAMGAVVRTGEATAGALGKLVDVVRTEAARDDEALAALERRLGSVIRRELDSDPPAPPSRPSVTSFRRSLTG